MVVAPTAHRFSGERTVIVKQLMNVQSTIRPARPKDAPEMARIYVTSWQETFRGVSSLTSSTCSHQRTVPEPELASSKPSCPTGKRLPSGWQIPTRELRRSIESTVSCPTDRPRKSTESQRFEWFDRNLTADGQLGRRRSREAFPSFVRAGRDPPGSAVHVVCETGWKGRDRTQRSPTSLPGRRLRASS